MSFVTFFVQECPTCGRSLEIRVDHLGKDVYCRHCGAKFLACQADRPADAPDTETLLRRAERLMAAARHSPEQY